MDIRIASLALLAWVAAAAPVAAQAPYGPRQPQPESRWAFDVSFGFDVGLSGDIQGAGIGTLQDQTTVLVTRSYRDVYGAGIRWKFGGGYALDRHQELTASVAYATAGGDVVEVGTVGTAPLFAQFDDYRTISIEFGYRYYVADPFTYEHFHPYVGGFLGADIVRELDAVFTIPQTGAVLAATDYYDRTGAFAFGVQAGVVYDLTPLVAVTADLTLRHHGDLAPIDGLAGTGLEDVNDKSNRWVMPVLVGARIRF